MNNIPQAVQLALAVLGAFHLLDRTISALTQFYFQWQAMRRPHPIAPAFIDSPEVKQATREEREHKRNQIKYDYANAMIQIMRANDGYTPEIARNAVAEIFRFANEESFRLIPEED